MKPRQVHRPFENSILWQEVQALLARDRFLASLGEEPEYSPREPGREVPIPVHHGIHFRNPNYDLFHVRDDE